MWRYLLFIPVLEDRLIVKVAKCGADAIILDLQAGVADSRKMEAREDLGSAVVCLSREVTTTVWINAQWDAASLDLDWVVITGVSALHLALSEDPAHLRKVADRVSQLEKERGIAPGTIRLIAMPESPAALLLAREIATASQRTAGLALGIEDYATAIGSTPNFRDVEEMESAAGWARRIGAVGGNAVHPMQVEILNCVFAPSEEEIAWAHRVVEAAARAKRDGAGIFTVDGKMVDLPIITRAHDIIVRHAG